MSYKNYTWSIFGHEYNSPYVRNYIHAHSFFKQHELLDISRTVVGMMARNNELDYFVDMSTWKRAYEELTARIVKRPDYLAELIDKTVHAGERLNAWTTRHIFERDLAPLSNKLLFDLWKTAIELQEIENAYGVAFSLMDYHDFSFVEDGVNNFLASAVRGAKAAEFYSTITEPEPSSFAQDQEQSLLELMAEFWGDARFVSDLSKKDIDLIKAEYPRFYARLSEHAQKYAWVYYVYMGPAFTEREFFGFVMDYVIKGADIRAKLQELIHKRERTARLKAAVLAELKPQGLDAVLLRFAGRVVWVKPRRKDFQSKSFYHMEKLAKEIARRLYVSLEQVRSAPMEALEQGLVDGADIGAITSAVKSFHVCLPNDDGSITTLHGEQAEAFAREWFAQKSEPRDFSGIKELRGSTACLGKATGRAKIVNVPADMAKMEYGDILVSTSTTPNIVPAMKRAAAIVTDSGGLTCHASIVSRELNIPCVVGLKFATRIINDGDLVDVDADKAQIRVLARASSENLAVERVLEMD